MEDGELLQKSSPEFDRLCFTVLAIEASAQKMGISPSEMRRRLDKVGLIKTLIQDCYDTLHTESREAVAYINRPGTTDFLRFRCLPNAA